MKLSREFKLGIYVIIATLAIYWGINFLKGEDVFSGHRVFYAVYDNTEGLLPAKPVNMNGYQVGVVDEIDMLKGTSGKLIVTLKIFEKNLQIPLNTQAQIYNTSFLGEKSIQLILGNSSVYAESGDTLVADIQLGLSDEINKQLGPIRNKAERLLASLDTTVSLLQGFLGNENQDQFRSSFQSFRGTFNSLERSAKDIEGMIGENRKRVGQIMINLESISTNLENNNEQITSILQNFDQISDSIAKADIASTMKKLNEASRHTEEILGKINRGEGSLGKLVNDDKLYDNLEDASNSLNRLLLDIKYNPGKYVKFSLFGGKDKAKYTEEEIQKMEGDPGESSEK